jgi:hypothetical protein
VAVAAAGVWTIGGVWNFRNGNGPGDTSFSLAYGDPSIDRPVVGNWYGGYRNRKTPAVVRYDAWAGGYQWLRKNSYVGGGPTDTFGPFGREGDIPVVGDWTSGGVDLAGVYSTGGWWSLYTVTPSPFQYGGVAGEIPVVGDWTGQGKKTVGVVRLESGHYNWYLRYSNTTGAADRVFAQYGDPGDVPVVGDWAGYGYDSFGVFRNGTWFLFPLGAQYSFVSSSDKPAPGFWRDPTE